LNCEMTIRNSSVIHQQRIRNDPFNADRLRANSTISTSAIRKV